MVKCYQFLNTNQTLYTDFCAACFPLMSGMCLNPNTIVCLDPTLTVYFHYYDLVPSARYTGGTFRVSKSASNGLKSLSGICLNPKTIVCLDPTLTVHFHYYRLGPECSLHRGKLPYPTTLSALKCTKILGK